MGTGCDIDVLTAEDEEDKDKQETSVETEDIGSSEGENRRETSDEGDFLINGTKIAIF
jgi:hypothetical protein